jgi:hypothetical protein
MWPSTIRYRTVPSGRRGVHPAVAVRANDCGSQPRTVTHMAARIPLLGTPDIPLARPGGICCSPPPEAMPRRQDLRPIPVLGSGPIIIGRSCDFDCQERRESSASRALAASAQLITFGLGAAQAVMGLDLALFGERLHAGADEASEVLG